MKPQRVLVMLIHFSKVIYFHFLNQVSGWLKKKKKKEKEIKDGVQNGDGSFRKYSFKPHRGTILGAQELASVSTNFQLN